MISVGRIARRLRYGRPVIVVSGLPRSGTSMAMNMLEAGGLEIVTDGIRGADASNPKGYYELEAVKGLDKNGDLAWLDRARGRGVKIISFLLPWLPETHDYRVIFLQRDLGEVIASQNRMLAARGEPKGEATDEQMRELYGNHLVKVRRLLSNRRCFSVLTVNYSDVLARPEEQARRIGAFAAAGLNVERMAAVADPALYRHRGVAAK